MTKVIVERIFPKSVSDQELMQMREATEACLALNDVKLVEVWGSTDRTRFVCLFEGEDVEAVRRALDSTQIPYERAWAAESLH